MFLVSFLVSMVLGTSGIFGVFQVFAQDAVQSSGQGSAINTNPCAEPQAPEWLPRDLTFDALYKNSSFTTESGQKIQQIVRERLDELSPMIRETLSLQETLKNMTESFQKSSEYRQQHHDDIKIIPNAIYDVNGDARFNPLDLVEYRFRKSIQNWFRILSEHPLELPHPLQTDQVYTLQEIDSDIEFIRNKDAGAWGEGEKEKQALVQYGLEIRNYLILRDLAVNLESAAIDFQDILGAKYQIVFDPTSLLIPPSLSTDQGTADIIASLLMPYLEWFRNIEKENTGKSIALLRAMSGIKDRFIRIKGRLADFDQSRSTEEAAIVAIPNTLLSAPLPDEKTLLGKISLRLWRREDAKIPIGWNDSDGDHFIDLDDLQVAMEALNTAVASVMDVTSKTLNYRNPSNLIGALNRYQTRVEDLWEVDDCSKFNIVSSDIIQLSASTISSEIDKIPEVEKWIDNGVGKFPYNREVQAAFRRYLRSKFETNQEYVSQATQDKTEIKRLLRESKKIARLQKKATSADAEDLENKKNIIEGQIKTILEKYDLNLDLYLCAFSRNPAFRGDSPALVSAIIDATSPYYAAWSKCVQKSQGIGDQPLALRENQRLEEFIQQELAVRGFSIPLRQGRKSPLQIDLEKTLDDLPQILGYLAFLPIQVQDGGTETEASYSTGYSYRKIFGFRYDLNGDGHFNDFDRNIFIELRK